MNAACAFDGQIYTCDSNELYSGKSPAVKYYHAKSTKVLTRLFKRGVKVDMVFIDGRLHPGDDKRIKRLFGENILFVAHDFGMGKGNRNIKAMRTQFKGRDVAEILPIGSSDPQSAGSPYDIDGVEINSWIAVMVSRGVLK